MKLIVNKLDQYFINAKDIRKCPNNKWDYTGIIKLKKCGDKLQCNKCDFEWQDPIQKISYSKYKQYLVNG
jgi:hypothetical protein